MNAEVLLVLGLFGGGSWPGCCPDGDRFPVRFHGPSAASVDVTDARNAPVFGIVANVGDG
jgi:hypothetical protein